MRRLAKVTWRAWDPLCRGYLPSRHTRVDFFLISTDLAALRELVMIVSKGMLTDTYDDAYHTEMGRLLGYPQCCVEEYRRQTRVGWSGYEGRGLDNHETTNHFWCRHDCPESAKLEREYKKVVQKWLAVAINHAPVKQRTIVPENHGPPHVPTKRSIIRRQLPLEDVKHR